MPYLLPKMLFKFHRNNFLFDIIIEFFSLNNLQSHSLQAESRKEVERQEARAWSLSQNTNFRRTDRSDFSLL